MEMRQGLLRFASFAVPALLGLALSAPVLAADTPAAKPKTDDKAAAGTPTAASPAAGTAAPAKGTDPKPTAPAKGAATNAPKATVVEFKTSEGTFKVELAEKEAPVTTKNFLVYVNEKFYDGTVFHRVINGFMIQGGGYTIDGGKLKEKPTKAPITNEAKNGLKNDRGTIAMARTGDPNSATAQFFVNLVNNDRLNYPEPDGNGYAVFGKVVEGMDVIDKIAKVQTGIKDGMGDVPVAEVKIISAMVAKAASH
jgi:peptidyl-prolyl cis-trans isomerase A (cyclophilin A)